MKKYQHIIVAGTFDRLHLGHQLLLKAAAKTGKQISCFVTTAKFLATTNKPLKALIEPYSVRLKAVQAQLPKSTQFLTLDDPFGPATTRPDYDSIMVTPSTLKTVQKINQQRLKNQLLPLQLIKVKLAPAADQQPISSERIRLGQIDRQGQVYSQLFPQRDLKLRPNQRRYFKTPWGHVYKNIPQARLKAKTDQLVMTVGDVTSQKFLQAQFKPDLAIYDCRVKRQLVTCPILKPTWQVNNPPGQLSWQLNQRLIQIFKQSLNSKKLKLKIKGEEDLAVVPLVLLCPLNSLVFYGQPDQGLVMIKVTEKIKTRFTKVLAKFH